MSHRLMFHPDCKPDVDLGMKQELLHMIIRTYNSLWLKIGLEVRT